MSVYATVQDVEDRWEQDIPTEAEPRVQTMLDDAEVLLASTVGDIAARIQAGTTTVDEVRIVVCNMVIRVLRNPGGVRQQAAGPFSYTVDAAVASGRLFLSREDRALLGLRRGAVTVAYHDPALRDVVRDSHWHWSS